MKVSLLSHLFFGSLLILTTYLIYFGPSDFYIWLTLEDGIIESLGAFGFLSASILFIFRFRTTKIGGNSYRINYRWPYLVLGLVFFVAFAEEISYGQRIFKIESPEIFQENNMQGEINLHNLSWFHSESEEGISKKGILHFFTAKWLFNYFCTFYFVLVPLFNTKSEQFRNLSHRFRLPIPPLWLGLLAMINIGISKGMILFFENMDDISEDLFNETKHSIAEYMESIWAMIIAYTAYIIYQKTPHEQ
ncbi:MAG: hypothetical protein AAF696_02790 [Bacteroidota bacterium]